MVSLLPHKTKRFASAALSWTLTATSGGAVGVDASGYGWSRIASYIAPSSAFITRCPPRISTQQAAYYSSGIESTTPPPPPTTRQRRNLFWSFGLRRPSLHGMLPPVASALPCAIAHRRPRLYSSTTTSRNSVASNGDRSSGVPTDNGVVLDQKETDGQQHSSAPSTTTTKEEEELMENSSSWNDILPTIKGSHNSSKIIISSEKDDALFFDKATFRTKLAATIEACRQWKNTSIWVHVPMERASLMEEMVEFGFQFHHALDRVAVLNLWLVEEESSKIPEFATHNVGVGAVVINSRNEILCVREQRRNYMPWKTPTGLTELGEQLDEAVEREVLEETGIHARFHSVLGFRQTHGLSHGRSDIFFVCQLDPVEQVLEEEDGSATTVIPQPIPQAGEIETASWIPLTEFRNMVYHHSERGHPMMQKILDVLDKGVTRIDKTVLESVVPGREPNAVYFPTLIRTEGETKP